MKINNNNWIPFFEQEKKKPYFIALEEFITLERQNFNIFPETNDLFNAFELTSLNEVKVVLIGQDPYHKIKQAHGLSFSVKDGIKPPASLINIYKELQIDLNIPIANHGNLTHWAKQGVLLLNATLTVREGQPGSHQNKGWETFTDEVIKHVSDNTSNVVFLLWGNFAKTKSHLINANKHKILEAAHPSPLARGAFFGCKHFSKTNDYLIEHGKSSINWSLNSPTLFTN